MLEVTHRSYHYDCGYKKKEGAPIYLICQTTTPEGRKVLSLAGGEGGGVERGERQRDAIAEKDEDGETREQLIILLLSSLPR